MKVPRISHVTKTTTNLICRWIKSRKNVKQNSEKEKNSWQRCQIPLKMINSSSLSRNRNLYIFKQEASAAADSGECPRTARSGRYAFAFAYPFQVMIVKGIAKKYLGAIGSEQRAARLYDKYAMIIQGLQVIIIYRTNYYFQAKTNFSYSKADILKLLDEEDEQGCDQFMMMKTKPSSDPSLP